MVWLGGNIVTISRAQGSQTLPANFVMAPTTDPWGYGYFGDYERQCTCSTGMIQRTLSASANPTWTASTTHSMRHIEVSTVEYDNLTNAPPGEPSSAIRARVEAARVRQRERLEAVGMNCNADIGVGERGNSHKF